MKVEVAEDLITDISRHAADRYPEECCGVLIGKVSPGGPAEEVRSVLQLHRVDNERTEERERRYLIGPEAFRQAEDAAERSDLQIVGFYHSHPDHPAVPSEVDRKQAWPWYSYLIVSVRGGEPQDFRSWRLAADRSEFQEESWRTMPNNQRTPSCP